MYLTCYLFGLARCLLTMLASLPCLPGCLCLAWPAPACLAFSGFCCLAGCPACLAVWRVRWLAGFLSAGPRDAHLAQDSAAPSKRAEGRAATTTTIAAATALRGGRCCRYCSPLRRRRRRQRRRPPTTTCAGRPGIGDSRAAWPPGRLAPWPLPPGRLAAWAFTAPLLPQPRAALQLLLLLLLLALDGLHAEQLIGCRASPWPARPSSSSSLAALAGFIGLLGLAKAA
jgi:hypothetical protein